MMPDEKKRKAAELKEQLNATFAQLDVLTADAAVKTANLKQDVKQLKAAVEAELAQRAK